jgi:hypothetical protein
LPQLIARATRWRASFHNLRVVYDLRSLPETDDPVVEWAPLRTDPDSAPRFSQTEWIWTDRGLQLFDDRDFNWTRGKLGYREVNVFNGPKELTFEARYEVSREGIEVLKSLNLGMAGGDKPNGVHGITPLQWLYSSGTAEWQPEILAKGNWKLEGVESVLGEPCARLVFSQSAAGQETHLQILWLDLKHDCLPRRHQSPPRGRKTIGDDFVVDEVQQLKGGLWFPKQARLQLQTTPIQNQLIVVTEAAINETLDLSRFDPPAPENETFVSGQRKDDFYVNGALTIPVERTPDPNAITNTGPSTAAVPGSSQEMVRSITLIWSLLVLVAIGLWIRLKNRG